MEKSPKLTLRDRFSLSMTPARAAHWARSREKGKAKFILLSGVLGWGLPMFIAMTFFFNRRAEGTGSFGYLLVSALLWTAGGLGYFMWHSAEKQYRAFLEKNECSNR